MLSVSIKFLWKRIVFFFYTKKKWQNCCFHNNFTISKPKNYIPNSLFPFSYYTLIYSMSYSKYVWEALQQWIKQHTLFLIPFFFYPFSSTLFLLPFFSSLKIFFPTIFSKEPPPKSLLQSNQWLFTNYILPAFTQNATLFTNLGLKCKHYGLKCNFLKKKTFMLYLLPKYDFITLQL